MENHQSSSKTFFSTILLIAFVALLVVLGSHSLVEMINGGDEPTAFAGLTQSQYVELVQINALQTGQAAHQAGLSRILEAGSFQAQAPIITEITNNP